MKAGGQPGGASDGGNAALGGRGGRQTGGVNPDVPGGGAHDTGNGAAGLVIVYWNQ